MKYSRANLAYKQVHNVCRLLILNASVGLLPRQRIEFFAFAIDASSIYEQYVAMLFDRASRGLPLRSKRSKSYAVAGMAKAIRLDGLLAGDRNIVVECKYKLVEDPDTLEFRDEKVRSEDLLQTVAYCNHAAVRGGAAFLVYPRERGRPGKGFSIVRTCTSFLSGEQPLDVHVALINVAESPETLVSDIHRSLEEVLRS
jgi:5-methylcytosine-specific restriction endonuclease McrBC regulatory subunit McrC